MAATDILPKPKLDARLLGAHRIHVLTDEALFSSCGVRVAFAGRDGGVSTGAYQGLNTATHVGDDAEAVAENRARLLNALDAPTAQLIVPKQVHGTTVITLAQADQFEEARETACAGADGLVVGVPDVVALLNFADCLPLIIVSPTHRFVVAHAGWRGAVAHMASIAVRALAEADGVDGNGMPISSYNAYIGPHIGDCCFEVGPEVVEQFIAEFGEQVVPSERHVSLSRAVTLDLEREGMDPTRIVDADECTMCNPDRYYSYRAEAGTCGRQAALAFAQKG